MAENLLLTLFKGNPLNSYFQDHLSVAQWNAQSEFSPWRAAECAMDQKSSFNVGEIVVCIPMHAGASRYPMFGKIVNITSSGKYRINLLETVFPPCDRNTEGVSGSRRLIKPGNELPDTIKLSQRSLLAKWSLEYPNELYAKSKYHHGCNFWYHYNSNQDYWAVHDNGD
jgi:hypothetical protein